MHAAMADLDDIFDYIEADDPRAAAVTNERIEAATTRLIDYPNSGRPGRVEGTRELVVRGAPYVLPYRIDGDAVQILRVLHAARLWPEELPDE
jgi:addiction module RelE/StbE family toxin